MFSKQISFLGPKTSVGAATNTMPPDAYVVNELSKKLKAQNKNSNTACVHCPLHSKKCDLNRLEECYWAQWKPSKAAGVNKVGPIQVNRFVESTTGCVRFPFINASSCTDNNLSNAPCQNCQRIIQNKLLQKTKCPHCYKMLKNQFSTLASNCCPNEQNSWVESSTDCECTSSARQSEWESDGCSCGHPQRKKTKDIGVNCPCNVSGCERHQQKFNKSVPTSSDAYRGYVDDEVPVKDSPNKKHYYNQNQDEEDYGPVVPSQYQCVHFDMEDECCGVSSITKSPPSATTSTESENARQSGISSEAGSLGEPNSAWCSCAGKKERAKSPQIHQLHPKPEADDLLGNHVDHHVGHHDENDYQDNHKLKDNMEDYCNDKNDKLLQHMKRLSEYIPHDAKDLVKEVAKIITSEPIQEIKRQAEKILECPFDVSHHDMVSLPENKPPDPTLSVEYKFPRHSTDNDSLNAHTPSFSIQEKTEINENILLQEQTRLRRQQDQIYVQEQLRKIQQQQLQQQLQEQRKLLEEQAKEIQRQRDLQKKQALLHQQEQQLKVQQQQQLQRMQQLDAVSLKLRLQQEITKDAVNASAMAKSLQVQKFKENSIDGQIAQSPRKPFLARVTGALKHSYPLSRSTKRDRNKGKTRTKN